MNQQPDKLFRDKLQSFQAPAPSGAWNRIEANLKKKNEKVLWFRIAASLLLVAIAAYLLWPSKSITTQHEIVGKTKKEQQATPEQKQQDKIVPVPVPDETKIAQREQTNVKHPVKKEKKNSETEKRESPQETGNITESNNLAQINSNDEGVLETIGAPIETQTVVVANAETQKVKIIFSADEIDNKYLDKKALAEATSDDKKPSTLKKLLDKAYDLKYNQDPFGDLRQRKDEILALNFRKDKRSDNK